MNFEGILYDGKTSKGHSVHIRLAPGGLEILQFRGDGSEKRLYWPIDEIREKGEANLQKTVLAHGFGQAMYLEVSDSPFGQALKNAYPAWNPSKSWVKKSAGIGVGGLVTLGGVILLFIYLIIGHLLPFLAEQAAINMPQSWETQMGQSLRENFLINEDVDPAKTRLLNQFYGKLKPLPVGLNEDAEATSGLKPIGLTFVKNKQFNAFALPGRQVVVFQGAIEEMESYPELVALLGHECGHVEARHAMRSVFRSLSTYLAISIFLGDVGGITAVLIENANSIRQLSFSRDFEREADRCSHKMLCINQIDPNGTVLLMKAMQEIAGDKELNNDLSFLSSHPMTSERIENAKQEMKDKKCPFDAPDPELERLFLELKGRR